ITDSIGCKVISNGYSFLGISQLTLNESDVRIYPNPVSDEAVIYFNSPLINDVELNITDMLGQKLNQWILEKSKTAYSLSMRTFSNGIYLLQIHINNQTINKKFVVLHN